MTNFVVTQQREAKATIGSVGFSLLSDIKSRDLSKNQKNHVMKRLPLIITAIVLFSNLFSQNITQTVRGKVYDAVTQEGLIGATVMVRDSDPVIGTVCDFDGNFELTNIPVGRQAIQVSMIGYETYLVNELMISSGKETYLDIPLQMSNVMLEGVVVTIGKDEPLNTMTTLSARQFTVEETERYAGGLDDPSRLASSFAGVASPSVSSNGISIRGNNPQGLLWRIEGVEVPSPSHFANLTVVGGGLFTALSNQMLANSDFYTGAFPAEYGNASSGVFDIKMKTGNTADREYTFKAGLIGIDFATEGPFKKGKNASYAANYRYSTLGLLTSILPEDAGLITFQDFSFKTVFPTKNAGTFSLWGIGALDRIDVAAADSTEWETHSDRDDADDKLYLFAAGLSHKVLLGEKTFLNSTISASGNGFTHKEDRLGFHMEKYPQSNVSNSDRRFTLQSSVNHRFGNKHTNRTGFYFTHLGYDVNVKQAAADGLPLETLADGKGQSGLLQVYTQSRINPMPNLTLNLGVHYQQFLLNNNSSLEPRVGIKYDLKPKHSIAFAYGLHSRLEALQVYFVDDNGNKPNENLELMKSNHFVLAYEAKLSDNVRFKVEPYYQYLTNVPVSPTSYISTLNTEQNIFFDEALINQGTATNIGVDVTFERFLNNGFYYLFTASLFDFNYKGADGIERNTRYNKNYVFNALIGKEWMVGKDNNNVLGANIRLNYLGGNRLEPLDVAASLDAQDAIYNETNGTLAYSEQSDPLPIISVGVSFRRNKPQFASVWSLQVINAARTQEFVEDYYDFKKQTLEQKYNGILVPNISYKIEF